MESSETVAASEKDSGSGAAFTLEVTTREERGSSAARRLRKQGLLPAVIYGHHAANVEGAADIAKATRSVAISSRVFGNLAKRAYPSQVFTLVESGTGRETRVIVKSIQQHFSPSEITHVDFQELVGTWPVRVRVPLKVTGEAPGVKAQGGVLTVSGREVVLKCEPDAIPSTLTIDVGSMKLNDAIHARDIELPKGTSLVSNPGEVIASVMESRASRTASQEGGEEKKAGK